MLSKSELVDLLYAKATGKLSKVALKKEDKELALKYGVCLYESNNITSKSNISQYIDAVDNGYLETYKCWCEENNKRWF